MAYLRDARLLQVVVLAALLAANVTWLDLGASLPQAATIVAAALAAECVACRVLGLRLNWRSPLVTGLSLSLLLRTHEPVLWLAAGGLGVGSKFAVRIRGKHLFNPACFAIVVLLLATHDVWVSPGQWGTMAWSALLLAGAAFVVLQRAARADTAVAFLAAYAGLLGMRCAWLGDPWAVPLHQLQTGSLLIFAFFMVTDPRSTPDARVGRVLFAVAVAGLAYVLQFGWQLREGLFYALFAVSMTTPVLDRLLPADRFRWHSFPVPTPDITS